MPVCVRDVARTQLDVETPAISGEVWRSQHAGIGKITNCKVKATCEIDYMLLIVCEPGFYEVVLWRLSVLCLS